jgi:rod shape-determining protein MreD
MNWFNTVLILFVAFVAAFFSATFGGFRLLLGAQIDLLPSLMVYTALSHGLVPVTLLAICGGLLLDSLSANPMGVSLLPLFLIGFIIQRYRGLILRSELFAQVSIGCAASAAAPVGNVLLLLNTDHPPLLSWFSLWQWIVMAVLGGLMTPLWFWVFDWLGGALNYRPWDTGAFRADREIKRGRQ